MGDPKYMRGPDGSFMTQAFKDQVNQFQKRKRERFVSMLYSGKRLPIEETKDFVSAIQTNLSKEELEKYSKSCQEAEKALPASSFGVQILNKNR